MTTEKNVPAWLLALADEMDRAADLAERDPSRPVTRFDARRWAALIRTGEPHDDA
jgi:hypothetical protein